jgi:hypothetical protein
LTYFYRFLFRAPKDVKVASEDVLKAGQKEEEIDWEKVEFKPRIQWTNVFVNTFVHFGALVGLYQVCTLQPMLKTYLWCKHEALFYDSP